MPARTGSPARRAALAAVVVTAAIGTVVLLVTSAGAAPPPAAVTAMPPAPQQAAPVDVTPAAPSAPAATRAAPAAPRSGNAAEDALMARLREEVDLHPETAIALADEGDVHHPDGSLSDERAFLRMRALVHLGDIGTAREAARVFFERHPDSPLARSVFRLTGMRPMPKLGPPT